MTTNNKSFTIEEITKAESESEKLSRIKNDFKDNPDGAIKTIWELSNALQRIGADHYLLWIENQRLEAESIAKDEHIEELKAELEEVKYELEEAKDENRDLKEQLSDCSPRNYYEEIGMSEADFC